MSLPEVCACPLGNSSRRIGGPFSDLTGDSVGGGGGVKSRSKGGVPGKKRKPKAVCRKPLGMSKILQKDRKEVASYD